VPTLTHQEASKQIADKLKEANRLLAEASKIADEAGVDFYWGGPESTDGMGGSYNPRPKDWDNSGCEWDASGCGEEEDYGWQSSSRC
jgi:hypothetical protein